MADNFSPFQKIILMHARRYPLWQLQDVYKLAHQAALGSEHAVVTPDLARQLLEKEVNSLADRTTEPLLDPISTGGEIVRVHLQPYMDAGFSMVDLLTVADPNAGVATLN